MRVASSPLIHTGWPSAVMVWLVGEGAGWPPCWGASLGGPSTHVVRAIRALARHGKPGKPSQRPSKHVKRPTSRAACACSECACSECVAASSALLSCYSRSGRLQVPVAPPHARAVARSSNTVARKMARLPPRMSDEEKRIARAMHFEQGFPPVRVAENLGRDLSSVTRLLAPGKLPKPVGRPRAVTDAKVDAIVAKLEAMVDEADSTYEVTLAMLMRRARLKVCPRVVANALHGRGYWFRDLRQKPILTPDDVKARFAWAKKYRGKTESWWKRSVHLHMDNHMFKVATTAAGRRLLAKRTVRGVYRQRGKAIRSGHVKPNPKMSLSLGGKGILKTGGVGGGKVLVWHTIEGRWCANSAEDLYTNVALPALQARCPQKRSFTILEDNDPTGNRSRKAIAAKRKAKMHLLEIPKRSPDLNVLDYAIWSEVERRMRLQERKWPATKRETRAAFGMRLDRTASNLSAAFVDKAIADLRRRCQELFKAKGGLFEERANCRRPL